MAGASSVRKKVVLGFVLVVVMFVVSGCIGTGHLIPVTGPMAQAGITQPIPFTYTYASLGGKGTCTFTYPDGEFFEIAISGTNSNRLVGVGGGAKGTTVSVNIGWGPDGVTGTVVDNHGNTLRIEATKKQGL